MFAQRVTEAGFPADAALGHMQLFLENPQNWNGYSYVLNNPLAFVDPFGEAAAGHHLISGWRSLPEGLTREFAEYIKTGPLNLSNPNHPGFQAPHQAYNKAVEEIMEGFEQTYSSQRNNWSLSQLRQAARAILNSEEPAIKGFFDQLKQNNPRALAILGTAIESYRPSASGVTVGWPSNSISMERRVRLPMAWLAFVIRESGDLLVHLENG